VLLIVIFAALRARASRRAKIVATGIPGTATVRAADQTGVYVTTILPDIRYHEEHNLVGRRIHDYYDPICGPPARLRRRSPRPSRRCARRAAR
jgi:hypothetical protein